MPAPATLTGQDVGEAEGALTTLLNQVLSNTNITRTHYSTLQLNLARPTGRTSGGEERCSCWLPAGRDISAHMRSRRWREPGTT